MKKQTPNMFDTPGAPLPGAPLAERMRPTTFDEVIGQEHLLAPGRLLRSLVAGRQRRSLILCGPPGTGKTTIARLYADALDAELVALSAVTAGVKDVRDAAEEARTRQQVTGRHTLLFLDEIHRFSKSQQDALLPHVEQGLLTLIGATTENPSFSITGALRSRCQILSLLTLTAEQLGGLVDRALADIERGLGQLLLTLEPAARDHLVDHAAGDARAALGGLEVAARLTADAGQETISAATMAEALQKKILDYDKDGDHHFMLASAFIKSMRGSDPDAALFYMLRMLEAGEDPRFLLRRMVIFASEDVGNADPQALQVATSATAAFELIGLPEGVLALTQCATYLATTHKSNAVITAYGSALKDVKQHGALPVPHHLRQVIGQGPPHASNRAYKYPHDFEGAYTPEDYLPDELIGRRYYQPSDRGHEATISTRLQAWRARAKRPP
jgi:putative ATPase